MRRLYVHPLPVRLWHWINAIGCVLLVLTGIQIRYVGLINVEPFRLVVALHSWIGLAVVVNFFIWLLFYLFSKTIRVYHPELDPVELFRGCVRQAVYYGYGIFKKAPNPFHLNKYRKFNPLQSLTYQIVMLLLLPIQCVTGILLWDLTRFSRVVAFFGGVRVVDTVHVLIFIVFVAYIPFHAYLATLGRTPMEHFKAMFTGYEEVEDEEEVEEAK
ncbi:MAG: cytochrome b/b6 domain-containing protein [Alphaproteobacteria bacterium]|nr:cytochrome b/b6 domain-containing protein [Alphaproteobacteria bacterium]MDE2492463.1 cytochrome b/b6 domain-containing protein [Alphaproteobacteria bacterium]